MEITIKCLGKPAKALNVTEFTVIADLLQLISVECGIDSENLSLIFKDKLRSLKEYSVKNGDRIMVMVKPRAPKDSNFESILMKHLLQSYDSETAQNITSKFIKLLLKKLDSLSLDDIDRLATVFSHTN